MLLFLKKTYCSTIGVEYMHISDPIEKVWFRERMEKEENQQLAKIQYVESFRSPGRQPEAGNDLVFQEDLEQ